jgi:hypothetical protein
LENTKAIFRTFLHPLELAKAPFDVVGMDFMGPFKPPSSQGNKYIMVVTDYFSKYVEVRALPDQTAITSADAFLDMVVRRHGTPKVIVSDRGVNFTSKIFRHLCKTLGIRQKFSTSYHPATNGETKRFNCTLSMLLRKELKDTNHEDWEDMLGDVCFGYHSSVHSSTQETPFFLLYGRDPNIPIHNLLDAIPQSNRPASDFVSLRMESLRIAFQRTKEENEKAREQQREQYNKRAKALCYRVGERVLLDVKVRSRAENKKFISKYRGPFRFFLKFMTMERWTLQTTLLLPKECMSTVSGHFTTLPWSGETSFVQILKIQ